MTSAADKLGHPQVGLLECLVQGRGPFLEVGCGGGKVACRLGERSRVAGVDISALALAGARRRCLSGDAHFVQARAEALPFGDASFAGAWCFESLEHVWDPTAVVAEMVRVTRPGGFLLLSFPNWFSLDLHLAKRPLVRALEILLAGARLVWDRAHRRPYVNVPPELDGPVYPDCDQISALIPANFRRSLERMGCQVEFCDTTYMRALARGSATGLDYQRLTAGWFFGNFGDHVLLLARRRGGCEGRPWA
jgi:ubiquinone/menaquinone biosynthesis C-methylase UbiE